MTTLDTAPAAPPATAPARAARAWRTVRSSRAALIGLAIVAVHILIALLAPLLTSYDPIANDSSHALLGPGWNHWAGTDQYGRDVLARVLYGGRYALGVSVAATVVTVALGTVVGCAAALRGGWFDDVLGRVLDAVLAVPSILALLVVVTALGTGPAVIVLAIAVVYVPQVVRVVRGAALAVVPADYVTAARARGEGTWSILRREVLPNITDVVCVEFAMRASWVVLLISSLSFLGFGADPPTPDWGLMVAENRTAITVVPMASLAPIIALATLVVGLNLAADGLSKAWGVDRIREGS
ncbi:ABC transporter permease (plasmid) [Streptomyces sp. NBC_01340]|uniref:ABC transporter permease n=1 Tax=unclassified Streptomyces TaxID=2593676 RepID=UPI00225186E3|nr:MULTISPECIES: ABC transporter permease [unclassified Streptomyces]MCX4460207.1 ABC transporter permease [Streptomyces sp. NBC_01719]MCX4500462.1 ABC transporter permease [Streptomyces sp. NBC_01728]WSI45498.1 ABC transporter permease [Streptomyces sp. NBC_01340]